MAPDRQRAEEGVFALFLATYAAKYPKAAACLAHDREALAAFYDLPAEHGGHIRTTNSIESTFATVRARTDKTRGSLLFPRDEAGDGVHTVSKCREAVASVTSRALPAGGHEWHRLQGWHTGRTRRRVSLVYTRLDNNSQHGYAYLACAQDDYDWIAGQQVSKLVQKIHRPLIIMRS